MCFALKRSASLCIQVSYLRILTGWQQIIEEFGFTTLGFQIRRTSLALCRLCRLCYGCLWLQCLSHLFNLMFSLGAASRDIFTYPQPPVHSASLQRYPWYQWYQWKLIRRHVMLAWQLCSDIHRGLEDCQWQQLSQDSATSAMSRAALGVLPDCCTKSKAGHLTDTFCQSASSPGNKLQETPREFYEPKHAMFNFKAYNVSY